jgi:hypothetical protein
VLAVWDSFADVSADVASTARLTATSSSGALTATVSISLKNNPETDRLILVGHSLLQNSSGAAVMTGTTVSAVDWNASSLATTGAIATITVGQGPQDLRAAPNGRSTAVIEETSGNTTLLATPLDASAANVHVIATLTPPQGAFTADARWSADARYLYVATNGPNLLLRYEPKEDLSSVGAPVTLATLPGPPSRFDVDPVSGDLLIECGYGASDNTAKLVLYKPDGSEAARLTKDFDPANDLRIAPAGGVALMTTTLSGDAVHLFTFTASALTEAITPLATVQAPDEIVFYPTTSATGAALLSGPDVNRVTPVTFTSSSITKGSTLSVSLAGEIDLIVRGTQAGAVFATSVSSSTDVSSVQRVLLSSTGVATAKGTVCTFGTDTMALPQGLAVQR